MNKMLGNKKAIAAFTLPVLFVFSLIVFFPIIQTIQKSFYDWDGLTKPIFSGFKNYAELLRDPLFYQASKNGVLFAIVLVIFQIGISTLLALALMNPAIPFRRFFRNSYFIPAVLSVTVACQLFSSIYNPEFGMINKLFETFGLDWQQDWLSDTRCSLLAVAFVSVWHGMGYQFSIIFAGLKSVPDQYQEAAMIDGANRFQINTKVLIPLIKDTYRICLIMAITGGINAYSYMQILTKGGPGTSSHTLSYMTFRSAFTIGEYGYGCAVAAMLILQCLTATFLINKFMRSESITY